MQRREGTHHKARRAAFAVDRIHVCAKLAQHPKRSHVAVLRRLRAHRQHSQLLLSVGGGALLLALVFFSGARSAFVAEKTHRESGAGAAPVRG